MFVNLEMVQEDVTMRLKPIFSVTVLDEPGGKLLVFTGTTAFVSLILACWPNVYRAPFLLLALPISLALTAVFALYGSVVDIARHGMQLARSIVTPFFFAALSGAALVLHCLPLLYVNGIHPGNGHLISWAILVIPAFLIALGALACNVILLTRNSSSHNDSILPN